MNQSFAYQKNWGGHPSYSQNPRATHSAATILPQPPYSRTALERLPNYFCLVVHLNDWDAVLKDSRPAVLIPENADVLSFNWTRIFQASRTHEGHKIITIERGRVSEDDAKAAAIMLLTIGFSRVIVCADSEFGSSPFKVYGVRP